MTQLSNCCKAPLRVSGSGEGTSFYRCTGCDKPCDPLDECPDCIDFDKSKEGYCWTCNTKYPVDPEFNLQLCLDCNQMTNHLDDICQKCKPRPTENVTLKLSYPEEGEYLFIGKDSLGYSTGKVYKLRFSKPNSPYWDGKDNQYKVCPITIISPFYCPYSSFKSFEHNWRKL